MYLFLKRYIFVLGQNVCDFSVLIVDFKNVKVCSVSAQPVFLRFTLCKEQNLQMHLYRHIKPCTRNETTPNSPTSQ